MTDMAYFHGGGLEQACAAFGGRAEDWIDLSTGINPHPWSGADAMHPDWCRLPETGALAALEAAAAQHFGCDPAHVCALPGSELGLRLLGQLSDLPVLSLQRSYRTHGEIGARGRAMAYVDERTLGRQLLLVANPNNPDGRVTPVAELWDWHERLVVAGGLLVIDEAFADCQPQISLASYVSDERRLVVMRSFGKFFGLAGVRLGFLVAPRLVVAAMRRLLGSWPLSAGAIMIGQAAYADAGWIADSRRELPVRAAALDRVLARHGLQVRGECPLFRLVETSHAHDMFERLAQRAILTRPFDYDPGWLRLGLPADNAALARLDEALAEALVDG